MTTLDPRDTIYEVLRNFNMPNMTYEDDPSAAFPLVDLCSNDGTTIETGESVLRDLADEIAAALPPQPVEVTEEMVVKAENAYANGGVTKFERMRSAIEAALAIRPSGDGIRAGRAEVIEECAKVIDSYHVDASFDDSSMGYVERDALFKNLAAAIRALIVPPPA